MEAVGQSGRAKSSGATPIPKECEVHDTTIERTYARRVAGSCGCEWYRIGHTTRKCMRVEQFGGIIPILHPRISHSI